MKKQTSFISSSNKWLTIDNNVTIWRQHFEKAFAPPVTLTHRCSTCLSSWPRPGRTRSRSSSRSTRRCTRPARRPPDSRCSNALSSRHPPLPRPPFAPFAWAGWSCARVLIRTEERASRTKRKRRRVKEKHFVTTCNKCRREKYDAADPGSNAHLKKWLFPHRILSPWWSCTGFTTSVPFTYVLQRKHKANIWCASTETNELSQKY